MATDKGERAKLTNSLTSRDRRRMFKALGDAQEAIESAMDARDRLMAEYWSKGLPVGGLMASTGLGYETVKKALREQGQDVDPK